MSGKYSLKSRLSRLVRLLEENVAVNVNQQQRSPAAFARDVKWRWQKRGPLELGDSYRGAVGFCGPSTGANITPGVTDSRCSFSSTVHAIRRHKTTSPVASCKSVSNAMCSRGSCFFKVFKSSSLVEEYLMAALSSAQCFPTLFE